MNLFRNLAAVAAAAMTALLLATPAAAQATRTWVSGVGDDSNPCSRTSPCQTFSGAFAKTATGGEIDCLDPGGFGALTITKSITIDCSAAGNIGGVAVSGVNGFVISGGTQVQLIGLDFDGLTTGLNGVLVNGSNINVAIINCVIYEFQISSSTNGAAVFIAGSNDTVTITNTVMRNNSAGVVVSPASGASTAVLDHVLIDSNSTTAVTTPKALSGGLLTKTGGTAILNASTLVNASPAISNNGSVISYGNNAIHGNILGTAITTTPLQ